MDHLGTSLMGSIEHGSHSSAGGGNTGADAAVLQSEMARQCIVDNQTQKVPIESKTITKMRASEVEDNLQAGQGYFAVRPPPSPISHNFT